jgi:phosphoribosylformylglycinamidine cyclo-ligase
LVRILPQACTAMVDPGTWDLPPLFQTLQQAGQISTQEMREVFNLGVGLVAVLPPNAVSAAQAAATEDGVTTWVMGDIQRGRGVVRFARP